MINTPPPFKGLNIRIPIITPIKGRGFINQGSGLDSEIFFFSYGLHETVCKTKRRLRHIELGSPSMS